MKRSDSAFTLIELLVVTAIVGTLAALATAAASNIADNSKRPQSLALLRAIGTASQLYSNENHGALPKSEHEGESWVFGLVPYLGLPEKPSLADFRKVYRAPGDPNTRRNNSYALNDFLTPSPYGASDLDFSRRQSVPKPSQTLHFAEVADRFEGSDHFHFASSGFAAGSINAQVATTRYRNTGVYLFLDGHVETLTQEAVVERANHPQSTFIHPGGGESSVAND